MHSTNAGKTLTVFASSSDHVQGPAGATLEAIEYGDFECPSCAQAYPAVKMLLARSGHHFRFVFRHFPLVEVHPHAMAAAETAEAAGAQGSFWPMFDLLFSRPTRGPATWV